jgi:sterol 3beta-glucosyltransferase
MCRILVSSYNSLLLWQKKLLRKLATIKKDGAVEFDYTESSQAAKDLFGYGFTPREQSLPVEGEDDQLDKRTDEFLLDYKTIPPLKIVMLIVGTRGDVQPFIAIGKKLQVISLLTLFCVFP